MATGIISGALAPKLLSDMQAAPMGILPSPSQQGPQQMPRGIAASTYNINPETDTVEGRINKITDPNSALMTQAKTAGMQYGNSRGLINSSIGQTAAADSVYRAALPIAQQDAKLYGDAGMFNAQQKNNVDIQNQNDQTQRYGIDTQAATSKYSADLGAQTSKYNTDTQAATSKYGTDTQAASSKYSTDAQTNNLLTSLTIGQRNDLEKMATAQGYTLSNMTAQQINELQRMSTAQGYVQANMGMQQGFDITKMDRAAAIALGQMSQQQINELARMATAQGYTLQNLSAQQINDLQKMATSQGYTQQNLSTQQEFDLAKMDKQVAATLSQMDKQQANAIAQMAAQNGFDKEKLTLQQVNALAQLSVNASNSERLAALNIDANKALNLSNQQFQSFISGSTGALNLVSNLQRTLADIDSNTSNGYDAAAKTTLKTNAINTALAGVRLAGAVSGNVDFQSYVDRLLPDGGVSVAIPQPTANQAQQFQNLLQSGNFAGAASLGRSLGYTDADIAAYVAAKQLRDNSGNVLTSGAVTDYLTANKPTTTPTAAPAPVVTPPAPATPGIIQAVTSPSPVANTPAPATPTPNTNPVATMPTAPTPAPATNQPNASQEQQFGALMNSKDWFGAFNYGKSLGWTPAQIANYIGNKGSFRDSQGNVLTEQRVLADMQAAGFV